jgi:parallel beta-helix repeat protein
VKSWCGWRLAPCAGLTCTITGNSAQIAGGGVFLCTLSNCIVYSNTATNSAPNHDLSTFSYSCTTPDPGSGTGNINNEPLFLDTANGNFRLQSNSPRLNAGNNACGASSADLDGRPRIVSGTVDMGAYELQGAGMGEFIGWLAQFSLPTDGSADFTDPDGDLFNNYEEYRCGSDPTNPLSFLRLLLSVPAGADVTLTWPSAQGRSYVLERSTNLLATPRFFPLATHLPGQPGTIRFTITNAIVISRAFYRAGAEQAGRPRLPPFLHNPRHFRF